MINEAIKLAVEKRNLDSELCKQVGEEIMSGKCSPAHIASFLTALSMKGESIDEIAGLAETMRRFSNKISPKVKPLIDICGTGGDRLKTFNVSTAAAFVIAGAGINIAKHGNRAFTSKCGSADILEALGANINLQPKDVERMIEKIGIGFMFAPNFHPAMKNVAAIRKELGIRTIFNLIGPLVNPAQVKKQVIGVYSKELCEKFADVLRKLGAERALIANGDGMDEISTIGKTYVSELNKGEIKNYTISAQEFGIKKAKLGDLQAQNLNESAEIFRKVLRGEKGPCLDIVLINAAAGIFVSGKAADLKEGLEIAKESVNSGKACKKLEQFIEVSNNYGTN